MTKTRRGVGAPPDRPRWYQTLGFRLAVMLGVTLVAFDLLHGFLERATRRLLGFDGSVLVALMLAGLLAFTLAHRVTGRLARLSRAAEPIEGDDLPGPFDQQGHDEIAVLAAKMNALRRQVTERLDDLEQEDVRRREWIAQVSHDLRTPLTAQIACLDRAEAVLTKIEPLALRKEMQEVIDVIKMDADRVHTLADDLLEIARLDAGDALSLEPVPPGELARQAVRELEPLAAQRGIRIEVRVTQRLPVLNADGRRLLRALENLLRNAIQHGRSAVEVSAVRSGKCIRFEVRDDGKGLPNQPDLLDYLRRLKGDAWLTELSKRRSRADSAGLGLVVAQRVAQAHRGTVGAYNLVAGGAAFWLDIPMEASTDEGPPVTDDLSEQGASAASA
jgi:two-component system sensor histidine kinase MtrB